MTHRGHVWGSGLPTAHPARVAHVDPMWFSPLPVQTVGSTALWGRAATLTLGAAPHPPPQLTHRRTSPLQGRLCSLPGWLSRLFLLDVKGCCWSVSSLIFHWS